MGIWARRAAGETAARGSRAHLHARGELPGLATPLKKPSLPDRPEMRASVVEFLLEGLHLNKRLNKDKVEGRAIYRR